MCALVPFMTERVQGYQHVNERIKNIHRERVASRIVRVLSLYKTVPKTVNIIIMKCSLVHVC